jgi:cupin fold WbuC family metalloprotein
MVAMMETRSIPSLSQEQINDGLSRAEQSVRGRYPILLHSAGDEFNRVFNFITRDSYMQPHLHPGDEKIEKIHLVRGELAVLFFDDQGVVSESVHLCLGGIELVNVSAFAWHTYVMLTDHVVTYETMMGVYQPETWKRFANWAPKEDAVESADYLKSLRHESEKRMV